MGISYDSLCCLLFGDLLSREVAAGNDDDGDCYDGVVDDYVVAEIVVVVVNFVDDWD